MNYQESLAWIYSTQLHGIKLGLASFQRLIRTLGIRVDGRGSLKFIHVAGTNGKGSVCAFIDSILRANGRRTGLYTSPHLVDFRERVRVNGKMISEEAVAAILTEIRTASTGWEHPPTFFEIATALALAHFQREGVEVAVLETGLGGRLDATNVVTPLVSVITPIYFDHQQWLGNSLPAIALEKAGIIKRGVPVVSAWQRDEVLGVIGHIALHRDAALHLVVTPLHALEIGLTGKHQRWNAALAVHAVNVVFPDIGEDHIKEGLREVHWPGRFQRIREDIVLDGAHNPAAARRLVETWRDIYGDKQASVIIGLVQDKDLPGFWEALKPIAERVFTVPLRSPRTSTSGDLRAIVRRESPELSCTPAESLRAALALAKANPEPIIVTGSLFLVGEALAEFQDEPTPLATAQ